jgi:hypothetical protein
MAKAKRSIGREILEGLREIKRSEVGRIVNVPDVASIRETTSAAGSLGREALVVDVAPRGQGCPPLRAG